MQVSAQHKEPVHLIDYSKLSVNGITISKAIVDSIQAQTGKVFEPMKFYHWKDSFVDSFNYGHYDSTWHGIILHDLNEAMAREIFNTYYPGITKEGNYLYLTHLHFDSSNKSLFDIAIVKAANQFDIVKRVGTQAINFDISNEKIIEKLKKWHSEANFKIVVVDNDRVEAIMLIKPENLKRFVKEIYEFSLEWMDIGVNYEAMLKDCKENNYFWLRWDL